MVNIRLSPLNCLTRLRFTYTVAIEIRGNSVSPTHSVLPEYLRIILIIFGIA
jgi:hypothetical protein